MYMSVSQYISVYVRNLLKSTKEYLEMSEWTGEDINCAFKEKQTKTEMKHQQCLCCGESKYSVG